MMVCRFLYIDRRTEENVRYKQVSIQYAAFLLILLILLLTAFSGILSNTQESEYSQAANLKLWKTALSGSVGKYGLRGGSLRLQGQNGTVCEGILRTEQAVGIVRMELTRREALPRTGNRNLYFQCRADWHYSDSVSESTILEDTSGEITVKEGIVQWNLTVKEKKPQKTAGSQHVKRLYTLRLQIPLQMDEAEAMALLYSGKTEMSPS